MDWKHRHTTVVKDSIVSVLRLNILVYWRCLFVVGPLTQNRTQHTHRDICTFTIRGELADALDSATRRKHPITLNYVFETGFLWRKVD